MDQPTPPPSKRHRGPGMPETGEVGNNQPAASNAPIHDVGYHLHDENLNMPAFDASGLALHYNNDAHLRFGRDPSSDIANIANIAGSTNNPFPVNSDPVGDMTNAQVNEMWRQIQAGQGVQHVNIHPGQQMDQAGMFQSQMSGNGQAVPFANNMDQSQSHNQFLVGDNLTPTAGQMREQGLVSYDDGQARQSHNFVATPSVANSSAGFSPSIKQPATEDTAVDGYAALMRTIEGPDTTPLAFDDSAEARVKNNRYIIVGEIEQTYVNDMLCFDGSLQGLTSEEYHDVITTILNKGKLCNYINAEDLGAYTREGPCIVINESEAKNSEEKNSEEKDSEDKGKGTKRKPNTNDDAPLQVKRNAPLLERIPRIPKAEDRRDALTMVDLNKTKTLKEYDEALIHNGLAADSDARFKRDVNNTAAKRSRMWRVILILRQTEEVAQLRAERNFYKACLFKLTGRVDLWEKMPDQEKENYIADFRHDIMSDKPRDETPQVEEPRVEEPHVEEPHVEEPHDEEVSDEEAYDEEADDEEPDDEEPDGQEPYGQEYRDS